MKPGQGQGHACPQSVTASSLGSDPDVQLSQSDELCEHSTSLIVRLPRTISLANGKRRNIILPKK